MTLTQTRLRADAQRNREHLIAVAAEVFASGKAVSLDGIAKRAGVGSGTLYRHFPTREDLVEEVYRDQVRPLRDSAIDFLARADPPAALHAWMLDFAQWAGARHGICEALLAMGASGRFGAGPVCDEVQQVLQMLLDAGSVSGHFRAGIDPLDVGGILAGLLSVAGGSEQRPQLDRMMTIVVDGLRRVDAATV